MRKYRRAILRAVAENLRTKPSKYVQKMWERYQAEKYGVETRIANKAKGTRKKHLWKDQIAFRMDNYQKRRFA